MSGNERMTQTEMQEIFTLNVALTIIYINSLPGYRCRIREVQRTAAQQLLYFFGYTVARDRVNGDLKLIKAKKRSWTLHSFHLKKRAVDLIININGIYQESLEAYKAMGIFWEALHPNNVAGAISWKKDGPHLQMGDKPRGKKI